MNINKLPRQLARLVTDNSPVILTAFGVAGVATTAYLTHRASFTLGRRAQSYADALIVEERYGVIRPDLAGDVPLGRDVFKAAWKDYIPAASAGVMTATCIVLANRVGTRRAAAVAAAFTLTERAFDEYRDKVVEVIGDKKEELMHAGIVKDRLEKNPPNTTQLVQVGTGEVMIMEDYTMRVFKSDKETIRKAENDINQRIHMHDYASLSDFYDILGLEHTAISDEIGWNTGDPMSLEWSAVEHEGQPVLCFTYATRPFLKYAYLV